MQITPPTQTAINTLVAIFNRAGVIFVDDHAEEVLAAQLMLDVGVLPVLSRDATRLSAAIGLSCPAVEIIKNHLGLFGESVKFSTVEATTTLLIVEAARLRFGLPTNIARWKDIRVDISKVSFDGELPLPPDTTYGNRAR